MRRTVLALSLLLSLSAFGEEASIVGVYSSLEYHQQSGDIAGQEITILLTFLGLKVVTYCGPGVPVTAALEKKKNTYYFELGEHEEDSLCGPAKYIVKPTKNNLLIWREDSNPQKAIKLPRRQSYWINRDRTS